MKDTQEADKEATAMMRAEEIKVLTCQQEAISISVFRTMGHSLSHTLSTEDNWTQSQPQSLFYDTAKQSQSYCVEPEDTI